MTQLSETRSRTRAAQPAAGLRSARGANAALGLVCLVAVPFAVGSWAAAIGVVLASALCVAWALLRSTDAGSGVALCSGLVALGLLGTPGLPVVGWVLPLAIYGVVARRIPTLLPPTDWAARGRPALAWIPPFVVVPATSLWAWFSLAEPDLSRHLVLLPELPLPLLLLGGLLFAASNAAAEEVLFRGVIQRGLEPLCRSPWVPVVVQAAAFGLCHYRGFPSGVSGVVMAAVYGLALGALRRASGGLLAPWLAHVAADLTIFVLLLSAR